MQATQVTIELGKRWTDFKAGKKNASALAVYEKKAADDKARYEAEKESVRPTGVAAISRGKSSYIFFCEAQRPVVKEANPEMKATEITAELGKAWNALKSDKKRVKELEMYTKKAADDKARYEAEKASVLGDSQKKVTTDEPEVVDTPAPKKAAPKKTAPKKAAPKKAAPKKK
jgi:hypothetical protein